VTRSMPFAAATAVVGAALLVAVSTPADAQTPEVTVSSCAAENSMAHAGTNVGWTCVEVNVMELLQSDPLETPVPVPDPFATLVDDAEESADFATDELWNTATDNRVYLDPANDVDGGCSIQTDYCYRSDIYQWRMDGTLWYGIGERTIGKIRQQGRISLNGRQSNFLWSADPIEGPAIDSILDTFCTDGNGWRSSTSCGRNTVKSFGYTTSLISMAPSYYHSDDSDYYGRFRLMFKSQGNPNPSDQSGQGYFYAPVITSQYFDCDDDFRESAKCRFREAS